MKCPGCDTENEQSFNFCSDCGTPITPSCADCGFGPVEGFRFCPSCGTGLRAEDAIEATQPVPLVKGFGERRLVSVLFADLVGFTAFSEAHDPEDIRAMLTRYYERGRQIIEQFGGEVDKFIGDAITAFWGARTAREDDAERAVRAGLELVDAVAEMGGLIGVPDLRLRAGVLSGETSVGSGGNETGLIVGDIVNTASRLQTIAEPGSVYVGEATRLLTATSISYEPAGEFKLKGKSSPVEAFRAKAVVSERFGRGKVDGLEPPFVGRESELRFLKDQVHLTAREGRARLVSIVGEAGSGKSRLIWELLKYVDGLTQTYHWHQGRSPAYGDGVTFWALGEMVRQRCAIAETDRPDQARTKLASALTELVKDPDDQRWILPRLEGLLGIREMPDDDREELFAALRTFLHSIADLGTAVLVFEDTHWADDGLLEFIVDLIDRSPRHPIFVVTLARPTLLDRHPEWGMARRGFASVHLDPLSDGDMSTMVTGMVPGVDEKPIDLIVQAAAGVPLYAVEYVRTLLTSGEIVSDDAGYRELAPLNTLALPDSLHAVVAARIDRLEVDERTLMQDAAVLGQSFTIDGLVALTGRDPEDLRPPLEELVRKEILAVEDDARSPERGQHRFVQSVIREVAYGRLSKHDRRSRHLAVARHYEQRGAIEFAAVIASHFVSALELRADESLTVAARTALTDAAMRAMDLHSYRQALGLARQALDVPGDEKGKLSLWLIGAEAASLIGDNDTAIKWAQSAWDAVEAPAPDNVEAARVFGMVLLNCQRPLDAIAVMAECFDSADPSRRMMALGAELARAYMLSGQSRLAAETADMTLAGAEATGDLELVIEAINTKGTALGSSGRVLESLALVREAVRLAAEFGAGKAQARAINNFIVLNRVNGAYGDLGTIRKGRELAERLGLEDIHGFFGYRLATQAALSGRFAEAIEGFLRMDPDSEGPHAGIQRASIAICRWSLDADTGHLDDLLAPIDFPADHQDLQFAIYEQDRKAEAAFLRGDSDSAFRQTMSMHSEMNLPELMVWMLPTMCAMRLRDLDRLQEAAENLPPPTGKRYRLVRDLHAAVQMALEGDQAAADRALTEACEVAVEIDGPVRGATLRALHAELLPGSPGAQRSAQEAYEWFTEVGAGGYLKLFEEIWADAIGQSDPG